MVPYVDIIGICHSVEILLEIYVMRPFQAIASYSTLLIDFGLIGKIPIHIKFTKVGRPYLSSTCLNRGLD